MFETEPVTIPEVFGRYRILGKLGQGGMGAVFIAHDSQLDRKVALKVPFLSGSGISQVQRFYREAKLAANFHHPNLCPVYDVGEQDGFAYFTMPLIKGRSLSELIAQFGTLPQKQSAGFILKVAKALAIAHDADVIHRDLKPSNIMIDDRGEPVVMDFGLAMRHGKTDDKLTAPGAIVGTPAYMSPEQISGKESAEPTWDVYSLGVILYQMLTGSPPYGESVTDVIVGISTKPPKPPSVSRNEIDPQLDAICLKAISKIAAERYRTMRDFASDLARFLSSNKSDPKSPTIASMAKTKPTPQELQTAEFRKLQTEALSPIKVQRANEKRDPDKAKNKSADEVKAKKPERPPPKTRTIEKRRRQAVTIRDAASPMQTESKDRWLWASAGAGCFVVFACAIWLFTHRNESDRRTPEKEPRKSQESTTLQAEKSIKQDVKPVTEPSLKVDDGRRFAESNLNESEKVSPVPAAEKQSGERKNSHPAQDPKKAGTQKPDDGEWVADSQWAGSFKFLPPIEDYSGDVQLEITERIDEKFKARYSTEAGKFEWNVEGTIHNKEVKWEFVKAIKDNEDKSVVGNAYFEGRLDGKTLTGKFLMRNSSNTAEIRITRNP